MSIIAFVILLINKNLNDFENLIRILYPRSLSGIENETH